MKKYSPSISYEEILHQDLQNPNTALEYLDACLDDTEHPETFLLGLRDVAKAWGFSGFAIETGLNRESLYRMLSEKGNPSFSSLLTILDALDLRLSVKRKKKAATK